MHAHPSSRSAGRPPVRSMALTWASAVVPGLAHWVAGRRRAAVVIFSLALALLIGVVVLALTTSRTELLRMAVRPGWLTVVIVLALRARAGLGRARHRLLPGARPGPADRASRRSA